MIARYRRDRILSALVPALALGLGVLFASPIAVAPTVIALPPGHVVVPISGAVDLGAQANRTKTLQDRIALLERQLAEQRQERAAQARTLAERAGEVEQAKAAMADLRAELAALQEKIAAEVEENQKLRDVINARENRGNRLPPRQPSGRVPPASGPDDTPKPQSAPRGRVLTEPL